MEKNMERLAKYDLKLERVLPVTPLLGKHVRMTLLEFPTHHQRGSATLNPVPILSPKGRTSDGTESGHLAGRTRGEEKAPMDDSISPQAEEMNPCQ
jgi:hypothetical protein